MRCARHSSPFRNHRALVNGDHGRVLLGCDLPELPDAIVTDGKAGEVTLACGLAALEGADVSRVGEG